MKRQQAMTLGELLAWMVVSTLVLGIAALLLWQVLRTTARATVRGQLQQTGGAVMQRLIADLQSTSPHGITLSQVGQVRYLCLQPIVNVDGTGAGTFSIRPVLYAWTPPLGPLRRRTWTIDPPVALNSIDPGRVADGDLGTLDSDTTATESRVPDVSLFQVYCPDVDPPNVGNPVSLALELRHQAAANLGAAGQGDEVFHLERSVVLRNTL